ncbi:MAG TPA: phosphate regulon transcriptional regulator PhoB [Gammaproteobacteria bacterium]|nr:phosphate regulon transcriptional regulator PhoB [Gammaproteobacteria bacterium]
MADRYILVVEDEQPIRQMMRLSLERAGLQVGEAADARAARLAIATRPPDLVLLDWMLPGTSGLQFARELKADAATRDLPVIMVTARVEEEDRVRGLDFGCDDYVTKPFSPSELVARIRAVLRRTLPGGVNERIDIGGLTVDRAARRISVGGQTVELGPTEYRLLEFFAGHPDRVYSREQLLNRVWGRDVYIGERTVDVHIRRLRKALAPHGCHRLVQTVRGSGYRFSVSDG